MALRRRRQLGQAHAGCGKHYLEPATGECAKCGRGCCDRCAFEVRRRLLCIDCGIVLSGVATRRPTRLTF